MRIDRDESDNNNEREDGRRARLADLTRLESALSEATGRLKAIEDFIARRDSEPVSRSMFYAHFYSMAALSGKSAKHFRVWCDDAWASYLEAMTCSPRRTLDQLYGSASADPLPAVGDEK